MLTEVKYKNEHYFIDERGRRHGEYKRWDHDNKVLLEQCFYVSNTRHGEYKDWYMSGQLWEHSFYDNGQRQGNYRAWHKNGQPLVHLYYVNGIRHGEYKSWDSDGRLTKHCFFVNGDEFSFDEILYPETEEDRMYFKLKYTIPLLGDTVASCAIITAS